jgi:hypothetical protein
VYKARTSNVISEWMVYPLGGARSGTAMVGTECSPCPVHTNTMPSCSTVCSAVTPCVNIPHVPIREGWKVGVSEAPIRSEIKALGLVFAASWSKTHELFV